MNERRFAFWTRAKKTAAVVLTALGFSALGFSVSRSSHAAPASAVDEATAAPCAGCHGPGGASVDPAIPTLAGRPAAQLESLLRDFRDDFTPSVVMGRIAKGYDDRQIAALAAYFAAVPSVFSPERKADLEGAANPEGKN